MANRSYLVLSDNDTFYLSVGDVTFIAERQTLAQGIYCVPLIWLALFRPTDIRTQIFTVDGDSVTGIAPITTTVAAIQNLEAAIPFLNLAFSTCGILDDYALLLRRGIESIDCRYVTIELEEIACMDDLETFYAHMRYALQSLTGEIPIQVGAKSLVHLSEIDPAMQFPSAYCLIEKSPTPDHAMQHSHIIGCSWLREVAWETSNSTAN